MTAIALFVTCAIIISIEAHWLMAQRIMVARHESRLLKVDAAIEEMVKLTTQAELAIGDELRRAKNLNTIVQEAVKILMAGTK